MKSAHTKADVLTVGIKAARVIPADLPLSPTADLYKRPQSQSASLHAVNYNKT